MHKTPNKQKPKKWKQLKKISYRYELHVWLESNNKCVEQTNKKVKEKLTELKNNLKQRSLSLVELEPDKNLKQN